MNLSQLVPLRQTPNTNLAQVNLELQKLYNILGSFYTAEGIVDPDTGLPLGGSSAPVFGGAGADGLVPDPVTENGYFLKDDGNWVALTGGGDMLAATYDPIIGLNTSHAARTDNPHAVTAAQAGAYTEAEVDALIAALDFNPYKLHTKPAVANAGVITVYTGFTDNATPNTASAHWAVKQQLSTGSETWAGKTTFDQILDNYLSLTYT